MVSSLESQSRFVGRGANWGLALFLCLECGYGIFFGSDGIVDWLLWGTVGAVLVFNTLRRLPALEADCRWWVWGICTLSTLRFLLFEETEETEWVYWSLISFNLLADGALLTLGRSFSLMPARRAVRTGWFYRVVRHPAYTAYLVVDTVYVLQVPTLWNAVVLVGGAGLFIWRALLEERLLKNDPRYEQYMEQTRWRFLPLIY